MASYYGEVATLEERWSDLEPILVPKLKKNDHILDMGCAEGLISFQLAKHVRKVIAFDLDENKLPNPKVQNNITFFQHDIRELRIEQYFCEVICCLGVIHKIAPHETLTVLKRIYEAKSRLLAFRIPEEWLYNVVEYAKHYGYNYSLPKTNPNQGHLCIAELPD